MKPDDLKNFWRNHIKIQVDEEDLDFVKAKDISKEKAKELYEDPIFSADLELNAVLTIQSSLGIRISIV